MKSNYDKSKDQKLLADALAEMESDQKIKVGASKGNGFFYVGTPADLKERFSDYDEIMMDMIRDEINGADSRLQFAINSMLSPKDFITRELKTAKPKISVDEYMTYLKYYFKTADARWQSLEVKRLKLETYTPLAKRRVAEVRIADPGVDEGYMNIIIIGVEAGRYWMSEEAEGIPSLGFGSSRNSVDDEIYGISEYADPDSGDDIGEEEI